MATTPYKRLQAQCKAAGLRYKGSTAVLTQLLAEADAQANGQEGSGVCAQPLGVAGAADAGGTGDQEEAEAAAASAAAAVARDSRSLSLTLSHQCLSESLSLFSRHVETEQRLVLIFKIGEFFRFLNLKCSRLAMITTGMRQLTSVTRTPGH